MRTTWIIAGLAIVILLGTAVVVGLTWNRPSVANVNNPPNTNSSISVSNVNLTTANENASGTANTNASFPQPGWLVYHDATYGFSFQYPNDWRVSQLPNGGSSGEPGQVWPGTISVRPPEAQEEAPSFKAVAGGFDAGLAWLNEHIEPYMSTTQTVIVGGRSGTVVKTRRGAGNTFAIVPASTFTLVVELDQTDPSFLSPAIAASYQTILDTFRFPAS